MRHRIQHARLLVGLCAVSLTLACGDDDLGSEEGSTGMGTTGAAATSTGTTAASTSGTSTTGGTGTATGGTTAAGTTSGTTTGDGTGLDGSSGDPLGDTGESGESGSTGAMACAGGAWAAPNWEANAAMGLALRQQLADLQGAMGNAEAGADGAPTTVADLEALYDAGDPSLSATTSVAYDAILADTFAEFFEAVDAGPQDLVNGAGLWNPGAQGGLFGDETPRAFNEGGLELRQIVDKGVFSGATFYRHALMLTAGDIDEAVIDNMAALWGADAALTPDEEMLDDAAVYTIRMGYFAPMADALATAKSLLGDDACVAERDEAIVTFFRTWEMAMYARFVYYNEAARAEAETAAADDNDTLSHALHALAEGIGLAAGFYGLDDPASGPLMGAGRVVTDAQIDAMMQALGVDLADLGASTTGSFIGNPGDFTTARDSVEATVATALGLDAAVVEGWRAPTAG